jgi:CRP-like cAMP-binding protein
VPEGKRLAREGDLAYEFFVIREGTADVDVGGEVKSKLGPDDFFGEIGVLDEERVRKATVTATSPMKLVVMSGHDLRAQHRSASAGVPATAGRTRVNQTATAARRSRMRRWRAGFSTSAARIWADSSALPSPRSARSR